MAELPSDIMHRAAVTMRTLVADLRVELAINDYWASDHPESTEDEIYTYGVDSGLGGEAGTFAASWTPGVALAVADWLDAVAKKAEELRNILGFYSAPVSDPEWQAALNTARAYLKEPS